METRLSIPYKCSKEDLKYKLESELNRLVPVYGFNIISSDNKIKVVIPSNNPVEGIFEIKESTLEVYLNLPWLPNGTKIEKLKERLMDIVK